MTIPVEIIGTGLSIDDITENQKQIINKADLLVAGSIYLDYFKNNSADRLAIKKDIDFIAGEIKSRMEKEKIVVLASGDPLFFGIGSTLVKKIGKENIIIHPNVSSVIAAFARIKEPWHDACFISLHGKKRFNSINELVSGKDKIAILTDHNKNPGWIAEKLVRENRVDFEFYVFELLGKKQEKIFHFHEVEQAAGQNFKFPNVIILKRRTITEIPGEIAEIKAEIEKESETDDKIQINPSIALPVNPFNKNQKIESGTWVAGNVCFREDHEKIGEDKKEDFFKTSSLKNHGIYPGMPDDFFSHEKGLITKAEVRAVVLSKLRLISDSHVFWDLGAGSGSVSIEVSKFIPEGLVYAVEKNADRICDIKKNIEKFKVSNITTIHTDLPQGIEDLPDPDRIFIGGGGKKLPEILDRAIEKLSVNGIIVINMVLLQNIEPSLTFLKTRGCTADLVQLQVSCSRPMPYGHRLEALNPVWIISGEKH